MSDPGLSHRLRQRSRRAGFMIGISMILTIALCAVGFTVIYTALDGLTSDFISQTDEEPTARPQVADEGSDQPAGAAPAPAATGAPAPAQQQNQQPAQQAQAPTPTEEGDSEDASGFDPDFQIGAGGSSINLREGPSTANGIIDVLDPGTPLDYLDEDDSTDGVRWMMFATEEGLEGWVREIDVEQVQ